MKFFHQHFQPSHVENEHLCDLTEIKVPHPVYTEYCEVCHTQYHPTEITMQASLFDGHSYRTHYRASMSVPKASLKAEQLILRTKITANLLKHYVTKYGDTIMRAWREKPES
jgi:hypothetical protein